MGLMAWFRKYNKKIMAFVVIVLMIVFTIGPAMDYLSLRRAGGHKVIGYYGDNKKITSQDLTWAQQQLELLKLLGAGSFLRPQDPQRVSAQDLLLISLGELLFAERATSIESIGYIRQMIRRESYGIADKQINDIYTKAYPPNVYWLLLAKEARLAAIRTPMEVAKAQLEAIIPRLRQGMTYSQYVGAIVRSQGISEEQLLETFGDLMAVIEYGKEMCSMQNRTAQQVLHETNLREETIDANYVPFDASVFAEESEQPGEEKIKEHFEKYKGFFAGDVNEANPYGFGYKLPDRVGLEYIAVRLDDVASTVQRPTQQETEEFYQQHSSQPPIAYAALSDPNDPNSQLVKKTHGYAEMAAVISKELYRQKVDSKAEQILLEAKSITEANLAGIDNEQVKLTDEEIKERAIDYEKTAAQLSEKHELKVYAGKTGLLSATDMQGDKNLGLLYLGGTGFADVGLVRIVFAVEQLKASELGTFDARPPRLYENVGPLKDIRERVAQSYGGKNMMLVRVIRAEKAAEAENVNQKISTKAVLFDHEGDTNSIRELVIEDLGSLAAMDKTKDKAEQFVQLAAQDGWGNAINKFNKLYGDASEQNKVDANAISRQTFTMQTGRGISRFTEDGLVKLEIRSQGDPMANFLRNRARIESMLVDKFYALIPEDGNTLPGPGVILEFKPNLRYYCIESMTIHRLYQDRFDRVKAISAVRDDYADSQVLAVTQYNPENILKRMNFNIIKEQQDTTSSRPDEANTPTDPVE
jgi:hypothetical protein